MKGSTSLILSVLAIFVATTTVNSSLKLNFGVNLPPFVLTVPRFKLPPVKISATFKPSHLGSSPFNIHFPGISINSNDNHDSHWEPYPEPHPEPIPEPEYHEHWGHEDNYVHHSPDPWANAARSSNQFNKQKIVQSYRREKEYGSYGDRVKINVQNKPASEYSYMHQRIENKEFGKKNREEPPWDRWMTASEAKEIQRRGKTKFSTDKETNNYVDEKTGGTEVETSPSMIDLSGANLGRFQPTSKQIKFPSI
ncbi:chorion protein c at 7F [Brevipalpus obovatus]|uniref:chorion protein c at 7F n=1 Tax=Brevipalpus obovatus TaxID=246614 RepID=UPI003D9E7288